ncbi:phosphate-starvation-inducible PsiE family protein [Syntrophus buswellii]|uniref:phosphate-starvation-inducible PsiE family protein n=1 Tax=Syntrophus buswellii TaxID=43774 RepID=UPI0038D50677
MRYLNLKSLLPRHWQVMTFYQRFESLVAMVITLLITIVIVVTIYRLFIEVIGGIVLGPMDPLDHRVFQTVFGEILTVLIALEFSHTLQYVATGQQSTQTKVILLIALLAVTRKFIILDIKETTPLVMTGLAAIALALGIVYWLLRERDDRLERARGGCNPGNPLMDTASRRRAEDKGESCCNS